MGYGLLWREWGLAGRFGISIPLGRTEPNPFELGRLGLWHEHIQFGTGTWDPILSVSAGHPVGPLDLNLSGIARLPGGENEHGYSAGPRYSLALGASPYLGSAWSATAGLALQREEPEEWDGRVEDEGNLGRSDLLMSLGAGRAIPSLGALSLSLQVPLTSRTTGHQVEVPVILSLGWSR